MTTTAHGPPAHASSLIPHPSSLRPHPSALRPHPSRMPWLSASLRIDTALVDPLSDALMSAGALSVDVSDANAGTQWETPIFDEPDGDRAAWTDARVAALFTAEADVSAAMAEAFGAAGVPVTTAY